jgi:hypothetical protein
LATFADGWPFLVEKRVGRGRVMLVTTPLDTDWGTLPLSTSFLPFVQSAVRYLAVGQLPLANVAPGEPLVGSFAAAPGLKTATVRRGRTGRGTSADPTIPLTLAGDRLEFRYSNTADAGIYRVTTRPTDAEDAPLFFVVNRPGAESDLSPLSSRQWDELQATLGVQRIEPTPDALAAALSSGAAPREMWPMLLAAVLVLGLLELAAERLWSREGL